jgi:hypothetical protein
MARRHRIRSFVRFVVDEHNSTKAMGVPDTIGPFRISSACSKADGIKARQRATFEQDPSLEQDPILDILCCQEITSTALKPQSKKPQYALKTTQHQDAEITKLPLSVNFSFVEWKYDAILR